MEIVTPRECVRAIRDSEDPRPWMWLHAWVTVLWFLQFPLVYLWKETLKTSISYLIFISIAAAALGQISSWQAARVEVRLWKRAKEGG
jgi:hypothetical protein